MATIRERVLEHLGWMEMGGVTVGDFLLHNSHLNPQSVYPVFTKLCSEGVIRDSRKRRKTRHLSRRCIVWWLAKYGGTVPVWGSGSPRYSYSNRAKLIMDNLAKYGPTTAPEMSLSNPELNPLGTSSLLSSLSAQGWVRKTKERRTSPTSSRRCVVWDITALGRSIREKRRSK